jgi:hypothetical protein
MEIYIAPPAKTPDATLTRAQVLDALARAGLKVAGQEEEPATGRLQAWWIVTLEGSDVRLQFQETAQGLAFLTLEQSMFDNTPVPDRVCAALEGLGWEADQENTG